MDRLYLPTLGTQLPPQDLDELTVPGRHADVEVEDDEALHESIIAALKTVYDPEIPVDIYALGLIYGVDIDAERRVEVRMTLTAPACPVAGQLVSDVAQKVGAVPGVKQAHVELVWEPFWTPDRMSEEARLELGMF
ncbi:MAG: SUF system Fe-S cluster assembly protein [Deltaproteobacteria bacterium]|nr:SUF system Fe-S cluster assembly protein [Deltaproteobacteria bacterium]